MVNIIATEGRLVVKELPSESTTSGGLVLARPVNQDLHFGIVESVGKKLPDAQQEFKEGDTVLWQQYSGVGYDFAGETYLIINQKDIIAIQK